MRNKNKKLTYDFDLGLRSECICLSLRVSVCHQNVLSYSQIQIQVLLPSSVLSNLFPAILTFSSY